MIKKFMLQIFADEGGEGNNGGNEGNSGANIDYEKLAQVKAGNSVYDNPDRAWLDGGVRAEYLDIYRDHEYIRQHTKGMSDEETHRFALAYYGWDDDSKLAIDNGENTCDGFLETDPDAIPFI